MERRTIPQVCVVLMLTLGRSLAAAPQNEAPKPRISDEPLTAEQVAWVPAVESSAEEIATVKHFTHDMVTTRHFHVECLEDGVSSVVRPPIIQEVP